MEQLPSIWTLPEGDADFSSRWGLIKRQVSIQCREHYRRADWLNASKRKHRESTLWQRRFWEHQIRDLSDFNHHADYLHYNPVKHGYCQKVADWPYSTFHRFVAEGVYPFNWAGLANDLEILA